MDDTVRPIPEERPLTAEEHRLARWILEHGERAAEPFLAQLDGARVVSRCGCGCASVDFAVDWGPVPGGGPFVLGDFLFGEPDNPFGVFVFQHGGRLAGLEVYGLAGEDPPRTLPRPEALRPFDASEPLPPAPERLR
jgi:hypothetical protein